jgi:hypothetical protein
MTAFLFRPVGIIAGLLAGLAARRVFDLAWGAVDRDEPPDPADREVPVTRFVLALALEGAIFTLVRGVVDHNARALFSRYTGRWPGEDG